MGGTSWGAGKRGKSKYRAVRTEVDGKVFASKKEARCYGELCLRERAGEIRDLQTQVTYSLEVNGQLVCRYVADFVWTEMVTGAVCVADAKGYRTREYLIKKKLMLACHGISILEL